MGFGSGHLQQSVEPGLPEGDTEVVGTGHVRHKASPPTRILSDNRRVRRGELFCQHLDGTALADHQRFEAVRSVCQGRGEDLCGARFTCKVWRRRIAAMRCSEAWGTSIEGAVAGRADTRDP